MQPSRTYASLGPPLASALGRQAPGVEVGVEGEIGAWLEVGVNSSLMSLVLLQGGRDSKDSLWLRADLAEVFR